MKYVACHSVNWKYQEDRPIRKSPDQVPIDIGSVPACSLKTVSHAIDRSDDGAYYATVDVSDRPRFSSIDYSVRMVEVLADGSLLL